MSLRKGDRKKKGPAHQNTFTFKHNKNSKKTIKILSIPNGDKLCDKCDAILEWRKKYRKYKTKNALKRCVACEGKTIKLPYHRVCDKCAKERNVCPKCLVPNELVQHKRLTRQSLVKMLENASNLKERNRRGLLRHFDNKTMPHEEIFHKMKTMNVPLEEREEEQAKGLDSERDSEDPLSTDVADTTSMESEPAGAPLKTFGKSREVPSSQAVASAISDDRISTLS